MMPGITDVEFLEELEMMLKGAVECFERQTSLEVRCVSVWHHNGLKVSVLVGTPLEPESEE